MLAAEPEEVVQVKWEEAWREGWRETSREG